MSREEDEDMVTLHSSGGRESHLPVLIIPNRGHA